MDRTARLRFSWGLATLVLAAGCAAGGNEAAHGTDYMDDQPPSGSCVPSAGGNCTSSSGSGGGATAGTDGGGTEATTGDADACKSSLDCRPGSVCVAPFDGKARQPFACVPAGEGCVPPATDPEAEALWCADDLACCDPATVCTKRGLCEPAAGGTTGGSGSTTGTATGTSG